MDDLSSNPIGTAPSPGHASPISATLRRRVAERGLGGHATSTSTAHHHQVHNSARPRIRISTAPPPDPFLYKILTPLVFFSLAILCIAIHAHLKFGQDINTCNMSYMYPNYVKLDGPKNIATANKYSLWLYKEGPHIDVSINLEGNPVLFLPGHAGSSRQVRSIASSAHNQQKEPPGRIRKLDFFTVETSEEMSAFSGRLILAQAEYVNTVIPYILSLYQNHQKSTISILAHSMGGIVARTMFTLPHFQPGSVDLILTLATPHQAPPINLDRKLNEVYNHVNSFWRNGTYAEQFENHTTSTVALISVAGGNHDEMFPSSLTELETLVHNTRGLTVYSTAKVVATSLMMVAGNREWDASQKVDLLRPILTSGFLSLPDERAPKKRAMIDFPAELIDKLVSVESAFSKREPVTTRRIKVIPIPSQDEVQLEIVAVKKVADGTKPRMNIFSCTDPIQGSMTEAECLEPRVHWVPVPQISKSKENKTNESKVWHVSLSKLQFGNHGYLILDVLGGGEVFSAEFTNPATGESFRATLLDLIRGKTQYFSSCRIMNVVRVPTISSDFLKYTLTFNSTCGDNRPAFWPLIHASSPPSSDEKFLLPSDSLPSSHSFSLYASPVNPSPNVLLKILTDKACSDGITAIHLKIDLYASAGRLIERVGIAWIVFPVAIGIACLGSFGWLRSNEPSFAKAFVDHLLMIPSPVAALFGVSVLQARFKSFAPSIIPPHSHNTELYHLVENACQILVLGIADIHLPPIVPALYIFSGCVALVVSWVLRGVVYVGASFAYLAGLEPYPIAAVGVGRKMVYLAGTVLVSCVPCILLPHYVMVAASLLIQLLNCIVSRIAVWMHPNSSSAKRVHGYREMNLVLMAYSGILTGPALLAWLRDVPWAHVLLQVDSTSNLIDKVSGLILLCFIVLGQDRVPKVGSWTFALLVTIAALVVLLGVRRPYIVFNLDAAARLILLVASFASSSPPA
ncbi:hypothetical protein SeLEV6574_g00911 [Synchytrium endobioticum]|uniref:GPI inositol-deacylase n=1 Tax=Synchytrium endobioticum TaxID=286115 RepID=A0A507DFG5_9FUNG|nr:hypothetical protein SeLEV6574_g00911 [Synchytrium endobioticum]